MQRLRRSSCAAVALLVLFTLASIARADKFVLRDGSSIDADVLAEDEHSITIEQTVTATGVLLSRKLDKLQIQTWYRAPRDGPAYVTIPMMGVIGEDVTAASVRAGLSEARTVKPRYVVLAIDSPGGSIREMFDILDVLWERKDDFQIIAYAKDAYSAAAVIAMSCERVYIKPGGAIGAAVPFRITENGPADVEAKFRSIIEAGMRAANAHGGHADLLMLGMADMNVEIYLDVVDGQPQLSTKGPGKLIKAKGQILTLTASESAECGLTHVAPDMSAIGQELAGGPWHEATRRPWRITVNTANAQRVAAQQEQEKRQRARAREVAMTRLQPDLDKVARQIIALDAKATAAKNALVNLNKRANDAMAQVQADYDNANRTAGADVDPKAARKRAQDLANSRAAQIQKTYQDASSKLHAELEAAQLEANALRQRQQQLLATLPPE